MFNRKEYTVSAELQIPDYDVEAGIRIGAADPSTKSKGTHSIQIDFINKNIPQASLIGLVKYVFIQLRMCMQLTVHHAENIFTPWNTDIMSN